MQNNQISTMDLARFLLKENPSRFINDDEVNIKIGTRNAKTDVGRLLLNKTMHIISAIFVSDKTFNIDPGERSWISLPNGGYFVSPKIMDKLKTENLEAVKIPFIVSSKIKKILNMLSIYNYQELIEFAHEDENWKDANKIFNESKGKSEERFFEFDFVKKTPFFNDIAKDL